MRTDPDIGKIPTVVITPYYSKLLVGHALIYARSLFRHLLADGVLTACLKYWGRCRENSSQKSGVSNESLAVETNFVFFLFFFKCKTYFLVWECEKLQLLGHFFIAVSH